MIKIIEYKIVSQKDVPFPEAINEMLKERWQPLGAPFLWNGWLMQAMVKHA